MTTKIRFFSFFISLIIIASLVCFSVKASTFIDDEDESFDYNSLYDEDRMLFDVPFADQINENLEYEPGAIIVILNHDISMRGIKYIKSDFPELSLESVENCQFLNEKELGDNYFKEHDFRQILKLNLQEKSKDSVRNALTTLFETKREDIYYAQPNYYFQVKYCNLPSGYGQTVYGQLTDYFNKIQMPQAWNFTTGDNNIKVAIFEGVDTSHPNLSPNMINSYSNTNYSHGTSVASVIGAKYDSNHTDYMTGVCWNISMKSLPGATLNNSSLATSINTLNSQDYKIINISLIFVVTINGVETYAPADPATKQSLRNFRGVIVCGAGNDHSNTIPYPAAYRLDNLISVGSSEFYYDNDVQKEKKADSSNWNPTTLDIFAPGVNITVIGLNSQVFGIKKSQGTSLAAPIVSGVCALIYSYNNTLDPAEVKRIVLSNVDKPTNNPYYGKCTSNGRINAYKALLATSQLSGSGFTYDVSGSTAVITGYTGSVPSILTIPQTISNKTVTKIAAFAFCNSDNLTKVILPSGLREIGDSAFEGCNNLESVINNSTSIESIGQKAFYDCNSMKNISLNSNVVIDDDNTSYNSYGAFFHCYDLVIFTPEEPVNSSVLSYAVQHNIAVVTLKSDYSLYSFLPNGTFHGQMIIPEVILGETPFLTSKAFWHNGGLKTVVFPNNITTIPSKCFVNCYDLVKVIAGNVTTLGSNDFRYCYALKTVYVPNACIFGTSLFYGCNNLILEFNTDSDDIWNYAELNDISYCCYDSNYGKCSAFYLSTSSFVTSYKVKDIFEGTTISIIGARSFEETSIRCIELPSSITSIEILAFKDCPYLESLILESDIPYNNIANLNNMSITYNSPNVVVYSEYSFMYGYYNNIASVKLKPQVTPGTTNYIVQYYRSNSSGTTSIIVPSRYKNKAITSITSGAFVLSDITSVNLPTSIINIPTQAFVDCFSLNTLIVNGSTTTLGEGFYTITNYNNYPFTMYVKPGSPAASYASSHGISYVYI